jgi:hypothetical protein
MKTNRFFTFALMLAAVFTLTLSGCKKDKTDEPKADSSSLQQLSVDEENLDAVTDETMNDVNGILGSNNLKETEILPCNATIDSTVVLNDTITIYVTYNGLNCSGTRFRTGKVEIRRPFGVPWYVQGTTVRIKHINFSITRVATGKTIVLNSVKFLKNVSGGVIWQLGNPYTAIVHRIWGHVNITFEDNTTKMWNVARQKTYTGVPPLNVIITNIGFGTQGDMANLVVWGINRQGEQFYTQIFEPVVIRQVCGWDPVSGIKKHSIPADNKSATLTFGFNSNNQPVTGDECPTKYKLDWEKNNQSGTVYLWL